MNEIIEKVLLKEAIEFNGSNTDLKEKLRTVKDRKFNLEWISESEFKISSKIFIGTLIMVSNPEYFKGIKGYGKLTELENGRIKIELKTKLRIEFYFLAIIPLLSIIITFFNDKEISLWSIFLLPFILLWFWFIYRFQEKVLFRNFINYITIEKNAV